MCESTRDGADSAPSQHICANAYGQSAFGKIYYVDIMNDSGGVSIDSMVMERPLSWVARRMSPIIQGVYQGKGLVGAPVKKNRVRATNDNDSAIGPTPPPAGTSTIGSGTEQIL